MTEDEFQVWVSAYILLYPKERFFDTEVGVELWYQHLKDIPYKVASAALNKWVDTELWAPRISDIRRVAADIAFGKIKSWEDAWEDALNAVSDYGMYKEKQALESLDGFTLKTVKIIGYQTLCLSEKLSIERAAFRDIYNSMVEKEKADRLISQDLKNTIASIQANSNETLRIAEEGRYEE